MAYFVMTEEAKLLWFKVNKNTMYNTLKERSKYGHVVLGRLTLKDVEKRHSEISN